MFYYAFYPKGEPVQGATEYSGPGQLVESPTGLQAEVEAIAQYLLRWSPTGTTMTDGWEEALSLHRRRYDRKGNEKK